MLRFLHGTDCTRSPLSRREWLRIGGLGSLAALSPAILPAAGTGATSAGFGKARSVLLVYASGGQSQLDTWDPKPLAPLEIRGEFRAVSTAVPGMQICEHMPRLAQVADRYTILRTVSHDDVDHGSAVYLTLTGHFHARKSSNPRPGPDDAPTYGAALKRVSPGGRFPYKAVHVNGPAIIPALTAPGQNGGLLGRAFEPLVIGDVTAETVAIPGLEPLPELPAIRQNARRSLLQTVDGFCRELEHDRQRLEMDVLYRQAHELLRTPHCREAFDINAEPEALRDRYGRHRSGQACLLARRLVEAGVPFITVFWNHSNRGQDLDPSDTDVYGWDTHNDIFDALKQRLLPRFDESFATLLEDLDDRGLLDQTLVVCMGEFGRAPRVALEAKFKGSSPGRKHWASTYSIVLAGAGVSRGAVVGASDSIGGHPFTEPCTPGDVAATMFNALGVDPAQHFQDTSGRPFPLTTGRPIEALYGA